MIFPSCLVRRAKRKEVRAILTMELKDIDRSQYQGVYALCSGGKDSITLTHSCRDLIDGIIFIDTTIGVPDTLAHVRAFSEKIGKPLIVLTPQMSYRDMVHKYGFPGPSGHRFAFIYLKWKPIWRWARQFKKPVLLLSGVRKKESKRRMANVNQGLPRTDPSYKKMVWFAPLWDWSDGQVFDYLLLNDLKIAPAHDKIGLSGDCLCGAYSRPGEAELIFREYPEIGEQIAEIERTCPNKRRSWGNQSSMRGAKDQQPLEGWLCVDCHK